MKHPQADELMVMAQDMDTSMQINELDGSDWIWKTKLLKENHENHQSI